MPLNHQKEADRLKRKIRKIWVESKSRYGAPKIHKALTFNGEKISLKRGYMADKEEVNHYKYYDFNAARKAVFEYIESWYNRKRIHNSIDYMTPQAAHEASCAAS